MPTRSFVSQQGRFQLVQPAGHGGSVPDEHDGESDHMNECLCPTDHKQNGVSNRCLQRVPAYDVCMCAVMLNVPHRSRCNQIRKLIFRNEILQSTGFSRLGSQSAQNHCCFACIEQTLTRSFVALCFARPH